jgi:hypothetical protein
VLWGSRRRQPGLLLPQGNPVERYQSPAAAPEACRAEDRRTLVELAYPSPNSRDAAATRGRIVEGAQAQLGHSQMSTTLEIYTLPIPAHQREAVENLSRMVTNGDELPKDAEALPLLTQQIQ